jgi:hypothetical protein
MEPFYTYDKRRNQKDATERREHEHMATGDLHSIGIAQRKQAEREPK